MNTSTLRRLISLAMTSLAVVPLCALFVVSGARAAEPPAAPDAPTTAAAAAAAAAAATTEDESSESGDRHDSVDLHAHHHRTHGHHDGGGDLFNIGSDSNLARGQKADSVVSIFGSATSDGETGDVVAILGDAKITGEVRDSAVAVLGNMVIDGKVDGDAVAVVGNLELGPHAEIEGDIVTVGGTLHRDPTAIVHGEVQNVFAADFSSAWLRTWIHQCLLYGRPLALAPGLGWAWELAFAFLALYAVLALLFREGLFRCMQTFEAQPGKSILAGLIATLLTPLLLVLLCVTVIGIAGVPFLVFGLFCVGLFGKAVMLAWLGWRIVGRPDVGRMSQPVVAVLIGGALVLAVYVVPVLGFIVYKLLGFLGLGAVVYTLILAVRAHQAAKEAPRGAEPMQGAAPTPGAAFMPGAAPMSGAAPTSGEAPKAGAPASASINAALPRAGFWIRMVALLLDALLVGFLTAALHVYNLELLLLAAYGAVMWKLKGSTIGGIVCDLRVVRLDGREINWETAVIRALGCFLSLAVAGLGFIWIAFDANNQAWHDKIAGTVVVRVAKGTPLV